MTRSASKQDLVRSLGARPVVADALDPDPVARAVASAEPEVIVHQLTALSGKLSASDMRHPDRSPMAVMTNRLRTEGTDNLLAAASAVGARRFVAQSFVAFRWSRSGGPVLTEADPLDPNPPAALRAALVGIPDVERAVTTLQWGEGLVLRYGDFYGPGTAISAAPDAQMAVAVRKRRFPINGEGGGVWSQIHIDDAAAATVAAIDHGQPGIYNIVDDEPGARLLEREGQARARLVTALCELAAGLRPRTWVTDKVFESPVSLLPSAVRLQTIGQHPRWPRSKGCKRWRITC
jgi:nucleoside-diphosphate-sugar epimerase